MQARHSSRTGGYRDAAGGHVEEGRPDSLVMVGEIVKKLKAGAAQNGEANNLRWVSRSFWTTRPS